MSFFSWISYITTKVTLLHCIHITCMDQLTVNYFIKETNGYMVFSRQVDTREFIFWQSLNDNELGKLLHFYLVINTIKNLERTLHVFFYTFTMTITNNSTRSFCSDSIFNISKYTISFSQIDFKITIDWKYTRKFRNRITIQYKIQHSA